MQLISITFEWCTYLRASLLTVDFFTNYLKNFFNIPKEEYMALTQTQVSELYTAIFNRASEGQGNTFWQSAGTSAASTANDMLATSDAQAYFGSSLNTNQSFVEHIYLNTLGKTVADDATGIAYWVGLLDAGTDRGSVVAGLIEAINNTENAGSAQDQFNNRVAVSNATADTLSEAPANYATSLSFGADLVVTSVASTVTAANAAVAAMVPAVVGGTQYLTAGQDMLTGTANADTFIARGNSSLDNADILDGGAGTDTLEVMLDNGETAESPLMNSIEILKVQAQNETTTTGSHGIPVSNIDAQDMNGTEQFWSEDSRSDLTIEDVRRDSTTTTVGMRSTDAISATGNSVDYTLLFNPSYIKDLGDTKAGAALTLNLVNVQSLTDGGGPLADNPYLGFNFSMFDDQGNETPVIVKTDAFTQAATYDALVIAIQEALDNYPGLIAGQFKVATSIVTPVTDSDSGLPVGSKTAITVVNTGEETLVLKEALPWILVPGLKADNNIDAIIVPGQPAIDGTLTQTNVIVDNVGWGSKGGAFTIGNMSNAVNHDHDGSNGIQQFNVDVDRSSWLTNLQSTDNALEQVILENVSTNNTAGNGNIRIDALQDVQVLNAGTMVGSVNVTADLSATVQTKYMNRVDTATDNTADDIAFNYVTGANNDSVTLTVSDSNLEAAGSVSREDFNLNITTNAGNDMVNLSIMNDTTGALSTAGNWYTNHQINSDITITTGEGMDTVVTPGQGDFKINTEAGNDVVYADNTGTKAAFVFNAVNTQLSDLQSNLLTTTAAVNVGLSVTFQGITTTVNEVANSYGSLTNVNITDLHVNQAIKAAITADEVLNKLIVAQDGPANTLVIHSLVDGVVTVADLNVNFSNVTAASSTTDSISATTIASQTAAIPAVNFAGAAAVGANYATTFATDDLAANMTGADSVYESNNTINGGTGSDVIVLGTGAASNDVVVMDSAFFGNDTIVNFSNAGANVDALDFSAYGVSSTVGGTISGGFNNTADNSITVAVATLANDTAAEVAALFDAAGTATTATNHLYIAYDANDVGTVYTVTNATSAALNATATVIGTIHMAEETVDFATWATTSAASFASSFAAVPVVVVPGPVVPGSTTVAISAAGTTTASDTATELFNVATTAALAATIDQFDTTADKLSFGTGITSSSITIDNTAADGTAVFNYTPDSGVTVISITLTGLTTAEDTALTTSAGLDAILA